MLESTILAKRKYVMHVECVTNVTPTINDDGGELQRMAEWIRDALCPDTPWHVTRFFPYLDLSHLPETPVSKLERVRRIGLQAGLRYVYAGNVPGHPGENTCCCKCGESLIEREIFRIRKLKYSAINGGDSSWRRMVICTARLDPPLKRRDCGGLPFNIKNSKCPACGTVIYGRFES